VRSHKFTIITVKKNVKLHQSIGGRLTMMMMIMTVFTWFLARCVFFLH